MGIVHEVYVEEEKQEAELARWNRDLERDADPPYARYRIGLISIAQGRIEDAIRELRKASDGMPKSKQRILRMEGLLELSQTLLRRLKKEDELAGIAVGEEEWEAEGFSTRFEIEAWRKSGATAEQAKAWREVEFTPDKSARWRKEKLLPQEARTWLDGGFSDPKEARRWLRGGLTPEQALLWKEEFSHSQELAVQSFQVGIEDPLEANAWLELFSFPGEAASWRDLGFTPETSKKWLELEVKDPFIAKEEQVKEERAQEEKASD